MKVYCTIRSEAFNRLHEFATQISTQIAGCSVEIEYDRDDLKEIFQKNIQLMHTSKLFSSDESDLMHAFFGPVFKHMKHKFVDQTESGFDFILRHTFYRPRDLMLIGAPISRIDVSHRDAFKIKEVVDDESDNVVKGLMDEMKPFFFLPDLKALAPLIKKNVMTKDELDVITEEYKRKFELDDEPCNGSDAEYARPFYILYQIGMLGAITVENSRELKLRQRFVTPREVSLKNHAEIPPTEKYYLIHPALDHFVSRVAGGDYTRNFHRTNVIGNDAPWIDPATSVFVIKGDVVSFSEVMETEFYESIAEKLHERAEAACKELDFFEVSGGDSVVMIDSSADRIVRSTSELLNRAHGYRERRVTFRFGGAAGPISFRHRKRRVNGEWSTHIFPMGVALRSSARLEPHASHGCILVDDGFVHVNQINQGDLKISEVDASTIKSLEYIAEKRMFRVAKNERDPVFETKLYHVVLP